MTRHIASYLFLTNLITFIYDIISMTALLKNADTIVIQIRLNHKQYLPV